MAIAWDGLHTFVPNFVLFCRPKHFWRVWYNILKKQPTWRHILKNLIISQWIVTLIEKMKYFILVWTDNSLCLNLMFSIFVPGIEIGSPHIVHGSQMQFVKNHRNVLELAVCQKWKIYIDWQCVKKYLSQLAVCQKNIHLLILLAMCQKLFLGSLMV